MPSKISSEIENRVIALNGKATRKQIAEEVGLSEPTITAIFRRRGITYQPQHRDQVGENNHNFKGGIARSTILRLTRRVVKKSGRCLYTCERCGHKSEDGQQPRHHINRDRSDNRPENLEVLCPTCHKKEHMDEAVRSENGRFVR